MASDRFFFIFSVGLIIIQWQATHRAQIHSQHTDENKANGTEHIAGVQAKKNKNTNPISNIFAK